MLNAVGQPDTLLLVGGTSEIARCIAAGLAERRPLRVVLAARPGVRRDQALDELVRLGARVEAVDFDATDVPGAVAGLDAIFRCTDIDVAVVAQGVLPESGALDRDPAGVAGVCTVNVTSTVATGLVLARRMREQGHGVIVALSSVAAVRPRRTVVVYGATKAALDAFYTGLRDRLRGSGVRVLVVRPGFVHTRMTRGLRPAPFAVSPETVAGAVLEALPAGNGVVWVPAVLRPLALGLRLLPGPLFRRLEV